ncbi:hypothetical protein KKF97_09715, partial [Myxococcota bacterium]|nr:hypothetical protein [Myxococcota bacterium]
MKITTAMNFYIVSFLLITTLFFTGCDDDSSSVSNNNTNNITNNNTSNNTNSNNNNNTNNITDPCDVGEQRPCYTGAPETRGVGQCQDGIEICTTGSWEDSICEGEQLPTEEQCNGLDDDCDEEVDEYIPAEFLSDGVDCTQDICDRQTNSVIHIPNNGFCDNGLFCDGPEICDPVADCQPGTPPVVDDGVACTDDVCDENLDVVVHTPNNALCDDGLFCNGAETCDAVNDCQPGTPPVVNDNVACTDDVCDENLDMVIHTPNNALCDDGLFCNGAETCDALNGCQPGIPPVVNDNVSCTDDVCDENLDMVIHTPNNALC